MEEKISELKNRIAKETQDEKFYCGMAERFPEFSGVIKQIAHEEGEHKKNLEFILCKLEH